MRVRREINISFCPPESNYPSAPEVIPLIFSEQFPAHSRKKVKPYNVTAKMNPIMSTPKVLLSSELEAVGISGMPLIM